MGIRAHCLTCQYSTIAPLDLLSLSSGLGAATCGVLGTVFRLVNSGTAILKLVGLIGLLTGLLVVTVQDLVSLLLHAIGFFPRSPLILRAALIRTVSRGVVLALHLLALSWIVRVRIPSQFLVPFDQLLHARVIHFVVHC